MGFLSNAWWGLAVPENVNTTTSWGARAIFKPHGVGLDLLGDRQSVRDTGPKESQSARWAFFARHLDEVAMPIAKEASKSLRSDEGKLVTLYEDNIVVVQGNTNGSYGYCYLVAWLKEDVPDGIKNPKLLDESLNKFSAFSSFRELLRDMDKHDYVPTIRPDSYPDSPDTNQAIKIVRDTLIALNRPVHPPAPQAFTAMLPHNNGDRR